MDRPTVPAGGWGASTEAVVRDHRQRREVDGGLRRPPVRLHRLGADRDESRVRPVQEGVAHRGMHDRRLGKGGRGLAPKGQLQRRQAGRGGGAGAPAAEAVDAQDQALAGVEEVLAEGEGIIDTDDRPPGEREAGVVDEGPAEVGRVGDRGRLLALGRDGGAAQGCRCRLDGAPGTCALGRHQGKQAEQAEHGQGQATHGGSPLGGGRDTGDPAEPSVRPQAGCAAPAARRAAKGAATRAGRMTV